MKNVAERLIMKGMSRGAAMAKAELFGRCTGALAALVQDDPPHRSPLTFFVPGRIEVLGKHTDYAGGRSLLCATDRGFIVLASPRTDARLRVVDALRGETRELALDPELSAARGDWSNYLAVVARGLARHFPSACRGADIAFASDLPAASGMSSSSALVIGGFLALSAVNHLEDNDTYRRVVGSPESLGGYLGALENGRSYGPFAGDLGVGTLGGSQDQTAILCCRAGMLSRFAFCPVRDEGELAFSDDRVFVVAYSGIAAEKTSSALARYNEVSLAVTEIVRLWNESVRRSDGCLADAIDSAPGAAGEIRALLRRSGNGEFTSQRLLDRFEQFVAESYDIIPRAAHAFARGDYAAFGHLAQRSQRGAEVLLGNQLPETIALTRLALQHGANAASAFGAGFGGSVWALVGAEQADHFMIAWRESYDGLFPRAAVSAQFFVTRPGPGAMRL